MSGIPDDLLQRALGHSMRPASQHFKNKQACLDLGRRAWGIRALRFEGWGWFERVETLNAVEDGASWWRAWMMLTLEWLSTLSKSRFRGSWGPEQAKSVAAIMISGLPY